MPPNVFSYELALDTSKEYHEYMRIVMRITMILINMKYYMDIKCFGLRRWRIIPHCPLDGPLGGPLGGRVQHSKVIWI